MIPVGQYLAISGFKNRTDLMKERDNFEEVEVLAVSQDAKAPFKEGDKIIVRRSGLIVCKDAFLVSVNDCCLMGKS